MDIREAKIERVATEIGRMYRYEGQLGCGVSTAMNVVAPLELQDWYKKKSRGAIAKRLEETSQTGSAGHQLIEDQAEGKDVTPPEELKEWFQSWNQTQQQYKITSEYNELMVFSTTYAYGGQIDRVGEFEGKRCVIDYKTGRYSHKHLWQVCAYREALIEMGEDKSIGAVVLYLPRPDLVERGHKVRHYTIKHYDSCTLAFLCAYQTFKMLYYNDLMEAGMSKEQVFHKLPFTFFERSKP